jgi:Helix-turn-helix domain
MNVELITREDLEQFKKELFEELRNGGSRPSPENQKWLKSYQVKNLLKISPGTLQNLRMNGTLRFTKIGGILYYKYEDIIEVLEGIPKETSQVKIRSNR